MKIKLLAALLACMLLLTACQYIVVEDSEETQVGFLAAALAEEDENADQTQAPKATVKATSTPKPKSTAAPAAPKTTAAPKATATMKPTVKPTAAPKATVKATATPVPAASFVPLKNGSRDAEGETAVQDLQARLIELNYLSGKADGIFGPGTEAALIAFQEKNGLEKTGIADEATVKALYADSVIPMPTPEPTPLAKGAKGDGVKEIQTQLKLYGFLSGGADGDFGANTDRALKAFQQYQYDMGLIEVTPSPTPVPTPTPEPTPIVTPAPTIPVEGTITPKDGEAAASETPAETEEPAAEPTPEPTPEAPVFEPDGVVTDELKAMLTDGSFQLFREEVGKGSNGWEVLRLQYRLTDLQYHWDAIDGVFGGNTEEALKYFQKRNKLAETGIADKETQMLLFSAAAVKSDKPKYPYLLKISVADQRVYAYKWVNGSYSKLVRTMVCSTGTKEDPTPLGTFKAGGPCGRWYYFKKFDCWAQYAYRINGPYLFHSVIYSEKDTSTLRQSSVNNLGRRASHGCIRLKVEDAKWIYNNCPAGTTVTVY